MARWVIACQPRCEVKFQQWHFFRVMVSPSKKRYNIIFRKREMKHLLIILFQNKINNHSLFSHFFKQFDDDLAVALRVFRFWFNTPTAKLHTIERLELIPHLTPDVSFVLIVKLFLADFFAVKTVAQSRRHPR